MTLADELRDLAGRLDDTDAGLVATSAWRMDRLVARLAVALGQSEAWVRVSEGLDARKRPSDATNTPGPSAHTQDGVIGSAGRQGADVAGRITPMASVDEPTWYSTHGWEHRDDAHRVTFEGEGA